MQDLGSLIFYRKGFAFKSKDYISSGVPIVRVSNFTDDGISPNDLKFVSPDVAKETPEVSLQVNDIVVATVGSWPNNPASVVGRTIRVPAWAESALMNQNSVIIRAKSKSLVDQKFIYYQMRSQDFSAHVVSKAQGSANQASITLDAIFSYRLFWPKVDHRDAIVTFLSHLDDRIALLHETNATLEAIAQALFKSWFVDFDPVHARARGEQPAGLSPEVAALFPDGFEESALGVVPKGWRASTLGECCGYLNRGLSPKYLEDGGVIVINQKCIRDFAVDLSKARRHDKAQRKIDGRELRVGDVLVNSTGVGTLGRVAQVLALPEVAIVDSHVTVIRTGPAISWPYLGQLLMRMQPAIEAMGEGTTGQTELSRGKLARLGILVPTASVLQEFDDAVTPLKQRIAANSEQAQTLATLRDTLLPRLISGQLRLPDAETMVSGAQA